MKPSTPRKSRRRNQPQPTSSAGLTNPGPVSDYDSDAAHGQSSAPAATTTTHQSSQAILGISDIDDMNLRVLRRYVPSIQSYVKPVSPSITIYEWDEKASTWGDAIAKGPLFVCTQDPDLSTGQPVPRACIVVINRQAFDNFIIDLANPTFIRQNEDQKQLIEVHTAKTEGDIVGWGLYVVDPEYLDATLATIQATSNAVRNSAQ